MTSYCLKWAPLPPNDVGRIAHYVREGEGRHEGEDEEDFICVKCVGATSSCPGS